MGEKNTLLVVAFFIALANGNFFSLDIDKFSNGKVKADKKMITVTTSAKFKDFSTPMAQDVCDESEPRNEYCHRIGPRADVHRGHDRNQENRRCELVWNIAVG